MNDIVKTKALKKVVDLFNRLEVASLRDDQLEEFMEIIDIISPRTDEVKGEIKKRLEENPDSISTYSLVSKKKVDYIDRDNMLLKLNKEFGDEIYTKKLKTDKQLRDLVGSKIMEQFPTKETVSTYIKRIKK